MKDDLSVKEVLFCEKVLAGISNTEAYKLAGWKAKNDNVANASSQAVLRRPRVSAYLSAERSKVRSKAVADREEQEEFLTKVLRAEVTDTALTKEGPVSVPPALRDRLKATEALGKRQGHYAPEVHEVNGTFGLRVAAVVANLKKQA